MSDQSRIARILPSGPLGGYVQAPPSKNYTTRLVLLAALGLGKTIVRNPARNDDALALIECCRAFGAEIEADGADLAINGVGGALRNPGRLNPGNAGAVLRLLLGVACLMEGEVEFVTDHADSLGKRPNADLIDALRQWGAEIDARGEEGMLPIKLRGGRLRMRAGEMQISGARSSQFLSSVLFLAPMLGGEARIHVGEPGSNAPGPLVSRPLIDQTLDALERFGVHYEVDWEKLIFTAESNQIPGAKRPSAAIVEVNGDWPSAAALMSAVAVAGGMATIEGLISDAQGERRAAEALCAMGCKMDTLPKGGIVFHSKAALRAIRFNGDLATDAVLALVAAACFAEGTSRFENVGNLRLKECDRIREPLEELAKLGVVGSCGEDWIEIDGRPEGYAGGIEVDSRGDHRVAQMLAIVGLRCERGLSIARAEHIAKSYPDFFEDLARLGAHVSLEIAH